MKSVSRLGEDDSNTTALTELEKLSTVLPSAEPQRHAKVIEREDNFYPKIGTWYWVPPKKPTGNEIIRNNDTWLGCVMEQGSNYVLIVEPVGHQESARSERVHVNDFDTITYEPGATEYFHGKIERCKDEITGLLQLIKDVTARLGIIDREALPQHTDLNAMALATVSSQEDIHKYEVSLITAKDKELPELFEQVKKRNTELAKWMSAEILPIKALSYGMTDCVKEIENRIGNVNLYAGITEQVELVSDGKPAPSGTILHIMQTRLYMDEECLVNYRHGGMEFKNIAMFDEWLCSEDNLNRILPFPRCMVSFKVRRHKKERETTDIASMFINIRLGELDTLTFLYIRNGAKVYRMNCDLDFGHNLFPDRAMFHPTERTLFDRGSVGSGDNPNFRMITLSEYEGRIEKTIRNRLAKKTWDELHGEETSYMKGNIPNNVIMDGRNVRYKARNLMNPYRESGFRTECFSGWHPFDKSSVYYDDACGCVETQMKLYNRVVLIIQGLFDRSEVLHPHPPVKMWDQQGFESAVKLIYDGDMVIEYGQPPSFDEYWAKCNAKTDDYSVMIGQEEIWERHEARKENDRISRNWRESRASNYRPTHFRPYGNDGPGYLARVKSFSPKSQKCTFTWMRDKLRGSYGEQIKAQITIPLDKLFNASAYVPGDYKMFFNDPRTRCEYLQWAPLLLAAEEYHAGSENARPQMPV